MAKIQNLVEAEQILARYRPQVKELLGKDLTLDRMRPLMQVLDHPENKIKLIHVAGTSGKTSTCYFMANLLKTAGFKVGLTVSPHLDSITERIQLNLEPLSETEFCNNLAEFLDLIENVDPRPTYFELLIAFVYWYFAKIEVNYAVIETGLGGSFDATNIAKSANKVCVITDIGFDHMHVLGNTLVEIASQKAGIIQNANQVFMYDQGPEINDIFSRAAGRQSTTLNMLSESEGNSLATNHLKLLPLYQQRNWILARYVYGFLMRRDNLPELSNDLLAASMDVQVPGRMEALKIGEKTLIMDGAHNEQKMQAFVSSFQARYPGQQAAILLSSKSSKEYELILPFLLPICSRLIITTFKTEQDTPITSLPADVLAIAARQSGFKQVEVITDQSAAYERLLESPEQMLVITGSFYLLSGLRPIIFNR